MATDKLVEIDHVTDYISREAARMAEKYVSVPALRELLSIPPDGDCEKCKHNRWNGCYNDELVRACEAIDDAPEADVVEVVRCRDCKFARETRSDDLADLEYKCIAHGYFVSDEWFRADGRKDGEK